MKETKTQFLDFFCFVKNLDKVNNTSSLIIQKFNGQHNKKTKKKTK